MYRFQNLFHHKLHSLTRNRNILFFSFLCCGSVNVLSIQMQKYTYSKSLPKLDKNRMSIMWTMKRWTNGLTKNFFQRFYSVNQTKMYNVQPTILQIANDKKGKQIFFFLVCAMHCLLARWLDLDSFIFLLFSLQFHFMYFFSSSFFAFSLFFHSPFFGCFATRQIRKWFLSKDYPQHTLTLIRFHWPMHLWCCFFFRFLVFHFLISFHFIQSFLISYSIFRHFSIEHMNRSWIGRSVRRKQF